jgi:hypothetical protein
MIEEFEELSAEEREILYKAPVLVSVLASCSGDAVNDLQKADAIALAHLKTYTADPLLLDYYKEVERVFKQQFESTVKKYTPFGDLQRAALKQEMSKTNRVIGKLDKKFAYRLHRSLEKYGTHVKRADHSIFEDFLFPIPIPGLTDFQTN